MFQNLLRLVSLAANLNLGHTPGEWLAKQLGHLAVHYQLTADQFAQLLQCWDLQAGPSAPRPGNPKLALFALRALNALAADHNADVLDSRAVSALLASLCIAGKFGRKDLADLCADWGIASESAGPLFQAISPYRGIAQPSRLQIDGPPAH